MGKKKFVLTEGGIPVTGAGTDLQQLLDEERGDIVVEETPVEGEVEIEAPKPRTVVDLFNANRYPVTLKIGKNTYIVSPQCKLRRVILEDCEPLPSLVQVIRK